MLILAIIKIAQKLNNRIGHLSNAGLFGASRMQRRW